MNKYTVTVWPAGRQSEKQTVTVGARDARLAKELGLALLATDPNVAYFADADRAPDDAAITR